MIDVVAAKLREALAAGRSIDQQRTQALLDMPHMLTDHGRGESQVLGRGSERAEVCNPDKNRHAGQPVHDYKPMVLIL
jgi:hypothetical protein